MTQSFREKKTVHIYREWHEEDFDNDDFIEFLDVDEFVVVPLIGSERVLGVIVADNKFNKTPIVNESIELLVMFASQAALSIESYRNMRTIKKEMEKLEEKQDAIVESEKMAAVGRIAAHIAHEIRNPLVTMGGYARRIAQMTSAKSEKMSGKNLMKSISSINKSSTIILNESERLEKILSNVMDFTRPAKYLLEFNNINEILEDTIDLLKNIFQERKIVLIKSLADDLPFVKSDFNQLKQVFLNLIQNSMDATPKGGIIEITTRDEGERIIIRVKDSGCGIDEKDPNVIFEPFFTTKVTGVGLGLATVKKIIKDHNGEITVRNRDERGVEFSIILPIVI